MEKHTESPPLIMGQSSNRRRPKRRVSVLCRSGKIESLTGGYYLVTQKPSYNHQDHFSRAILQVPTVKGETQTSTPANLNVQCTVISLQPQQYNRSVNALRCVEHTNIPQQAKSNNALNKTQHDTT
jgi:hypothetical protein